jgi:hypothetical protein
MESAPEAAAETARFPAHPLGRIRLIGGSGGSRHRLISVGPPGRSFDVSRHPSSVIRHSSFVIRHSSFVIRHFKLRRAA